MTNKKYPWINAKNWWLLRNRFKQRMPSEVTINYLATVLGVAEKAAANVLPSLRTVGLIDNDNKTTDLANLWRVDEEYASACKDIKNRIYPEELLLAAPDPVNDLDSARNWFMRQAAVGEATARFMARFYRLLYTATPAEGEAVTLSSKEDKLPRADSKKAATKARSTKPKDEAETTKFEPSGTRLDLPELSLSIQVHISPDATPEQIEQIFACMAKHLYPKTTS